MARLIMGRSKNSTSWLNRMLGESQRYRLRMRMNGREVPSGAGWVLHTQVVS
jgi:hypothetical protein